MRFITRSLALMILATSIGFSVGKTVPSGQTIDASRHENSRQPTSENPNDYQTHDSPPRHTSIEKLRVVAIAFISRNLVLICFSLIAALTIFAYLLMKVSSPTYGLVLGGLIFFCCALSLLLLQHYLHIHERLTITSYGFFFLAFNSWLASIGAPFWLSSVSPDKKTND